MHLVDELTRIGDAYEPEVSFDQVEQTFAALFHQAALRQLALLVWGPENTDVGEVAAGHSFKFSILLLKGQ